MPTQTKPKLTIILTEKISGLPIAHAPVSICKVRGPLYLEGKTNQNGVFQKVVDSSTSYEVDIEVAGEKAVVPSSSKTPSNVIHMGVDDMSVDASVDLGLQILKVYTEDAAGRKQKAAISYAYEGDIVNLKVDLQHPQRFTYRWHVDKGSLIESDQIIADRNEANWDITGALGQQTPQVTITDANGASIAIMADFYVREAPVSLKPGPVPISLKRSSVERTIDQPLWVAIRNRTKAISFSGSGYDDFITQVLCGGRIGILPEDITDRVALLQSGPIHGVDAYNLLRSATQVFLLLECGPIIAEFDRYTTDPLFDPDDEATRLGRSMSFREVNSRLVNYLGAGNQLPYIDQVLEVAFRGRDPQTNIFCEGYLSANAACPPMLELIWSYWHEEGMLVQAMNAISMRFQNQRSRAGRDPLAHMEIAPLYPLNNLLWGYIQDEQHRLSVKRRNYEYNHHYGLSLQGRAITNFEPADTRSRFLEGFHTLLYLATLFYKQDDDTTVIADGFPILNALREVHQVLAEGAHNQFGDLPWTARAEMLMEQWVLSRPEMRDFLQSRAMVPYREAWMPQVDTMKNLQGWTDVSVSHFNYLATFGEQIFLSIRYGNWTRVDNPQQAVNWARYWRPEIQNYLHSYRAVTGVDLADSLQAAQRATLPSDLLRQRLPAGLPVTEHPVPALPMPRSFRQRRADRSSPSAT